MHGPLSPWVPVPSPSMSCIRGPMVDAGPIGVGVVAVWPSLLLLAILAHFLGRFLRGAAHVGLQEPVLCD